MCWLYFVPNLLVIQHLETLYLGGNNVTVVCERMWRFDQECATRRWLATRTVQKTRRPAQLGQPARVRPAATRFEDSDGRTRVPAKLTRPLTGRLSVFGFQTRNTWPEPIVYPYRRSITIFRPDPARSRYYPTKSKPDLDRSGQISPNLARFRPDLDKSSQILARSHRIRPNFVPSDKPDTNPNQPETNETRTEKSDQVSELVSGQFFIHPPQSGWVRVGHKPNSAQPMDTPTWKDSLSSYYNIHRKRLIPKGLNPIDMNLTVLY